MPYINDVIIALEADLEKLKEEEIGYINLMRLLNDPKAYTAADNKNTLERLPIENPDGGHLFNATMITGWLHKMYEHNRNRQAIIWSIIVVASLVAFTSGLYPDLIEYKSDRITAAIWIVGFLYGMGELIAIGKHWSKSKDLTEEKRINFDRHEDALKNALEEKLPKVVVEDNVESNKEIVVEKESKESNETPDPNRDPDAAKVAKAVKRTAMNQYVKPNRDNYWGYQENTKAGLENGKGLTFNKTMLIGYLKEERDGKKEEAGLFAGLKSSFTNR